MLRETRRYIALRVLLHQWFVIDGVAVCNLPGAWRRSRSLLLVACCLLLSSAKDTSAIQFKQPAKPAKPCSAVFGFRQEFTAY
jgi:hypothetical protein